MFDAGTGWTLAAATLLVLAAGSARGARGGEEAAPRIGFEENFDTAEGWQVSYGAPLKSATARDSSVRFETVCGALNAATKRPDWPEWPEKPCASNTGLKKVYNRKIDLDKYPYVVVKLDERGTMVKLSVCGRWLPICYTTGLRAFDLRHAPYGEQRDLVLTLEFLNTSGACTFDFIRLVNKLTDEERQGLLPPPVRYAEWPGTAQPYHRLEALNARAGRARLPAAEGQACVYRDTLSQGLVWKLTAQPGDQTFSSNDKPLGWTKDGRSFRLSGGRDGRNVWDYRAARWLPTESGAAGKPLPEYAASWESRAQPGVTYGYRVDWSRRPVAQFILFRFERLSGEEREWGRFPFEGKWDVRELSLAEEGDRAVLGLRGTPQVFVLDPEAADPAARVKPITLKTRLKGVGFAKRDTVLQWHNCYTYEHWELDLGSGETRLGYYTGGGHAGSGFGKTLRHYEDLTVVQPSGLTDWKAGDQVRIFAYYKTPLETDYGSLVDGGRWWLVNGSGGAVANQHLLVDGADPATVLRLCGYNTSRNNWGTNTYTLASPDATKVAWMSDQLGDGELYYVVARWPDPPLGLAAARTPAGVRLTWERPARAQETAGYCLYAAGAGGRFRPLVREPVAGLEWTGAPPEGCTRFLVAAREWNGLEGLPSREARVDEAAGGRGTLRLAAAEAVRLGSARQAFDGTACGARAVHLHKAIPEDPDAATLRWTGVAFPDGPVRTFIRARDLQPGAPWTWRAEPLAQITGALTCEVPPGVLVDQVLVTSEPEYQPQGLDDRFVPPEPVQDAKIAAEGGVLRLSWTPSPAWNLAYTEIHAFLEEPKTPEPENASVIGAVAAAAPQEFLDWDGKPGASVWYVLWAVDTRGNRSAPLTVRGAWPAVETPVLWTWLASAAGTPEGWEALAPGGEGLLAPKPQAAKEKPEEKDWLALKINLDVPADGAYALWARYAPGYGQRLTARVAFDADAPQPWELRAPYRPMSGTLAKPAPGKARLFSDRVSAGGRDRFELKKGPHVLTVWLDPTIPEGLVHALGQLWLTNDPSFRPPGFNPRADFGK